MSARALAAALALVAPVAGCSLITDSFVTNDFSGDPYPIDVELDSGAVVVGVRSGAVDRTGVLDVLSPITLIDPGPNGTTSVSAGDLQLLGKREGTGLLDLPRARLSGAQVVTLHPCRDETCVVGADGVETPYQAIIGANALAGDALRLRLGEQRVFVLADVAGTDRERTWTCDAVFPSPYRGGGTLVIAGTEVPFGGRRVTLQGCFDPKPDPLLGQSQRGADVLLVMSTGIGMTMLGRSAYERYHQIRPATLAYDALPDGQMFLPSGLVTGKRATIDRLALVATSSSSPRAPCRQVYAHSLLIDHDCRPDEDCPCNGRDTFCSVPAHVELSPGGGIDVLVVEDNNATLQALRTELRPDQPEVDGILGTQAIQGAEIDIDYPHNRVLARCAGPGCTTRPALADRPDRTQIRGCLGAP